MTEASDMRSVEELVAAGPDVITDVALGAMRRVEDQGRHAITRVTEIEIWALMLTVHFMGKGMGAPSVHPDARIEQ